MFIEWLKENGVTGGAAVTLITDGVRNSSHCAAVVLSPLPGEGVEDDVDVFPFFGADPDLTAKFTGYTQVDYDKMLKESPGVPADILSSAMDDISFLVGYNTAFLAKFLARIGPITCPILDIGMIAAVPAFPCAGDGKPNAYDTGHSKSPVQALSTYLSEMKKIHPSLSFAHMTSQLDLPFDGEAEWLQQHVKLRYVAYRS